MTWNWNWRPGQDWLRIGKMCWATDVLIGRYLWYNIVYGEIEFTCVFTACTHRVRRAFCSGVTVDVRHESHRRDHRILCVCFCDCFSRFPLRYEKLELHLLWTKQKLVNEENDNNKKKLCAFRNQMVDIYVCVQCASKRSHLNHWPRALYLFFSFCFCCCCLLGACTLDSSCLWIFRSSFLQSFSSIVPLWHGRLLHCFSTIANWSLPGIVSFAIHF